MFRPYIQTITDWLNFLGFNLKSDEVEVQTAILIVSLTLLGSLLTGLWRLGIMWWKRKQQKRLKGDLHPYFSATDIRKATQFYVSTHFQSNPPSQHHELIQTHKVTARQRLIPFFLKQAFKPDLDDQRFYIILAGSGMGKTTFMINLYLRYLQYKQFGRARFDIALLPLGYPNLLDRIEKIQDPGNTILLLDGLDEDTEAVKNYKKRLNRILDKVQDFRFVVFTCRTQFFPSEEEEPKETGVVKFGSRHGFQTFAKMYLSPFDRKDIKKYLSRKYPWYSIKRKTNALRIIDQSPNLMVRPMVLSYIDDLMEQPGTYDYASQLYEDLIRKWIDREANRVLNERREEFREELYRFSREVAINMYRNRKHRNGLFISQKEIRPFSEKHKIQLDEIEMQSRSLLNRNVLGQYKFAHKSILEYFLAIEASENPSFASILNLEGIDQAAQFLDELSMTKHTIPHFAQLKDKATCRVGLQKQIKEAGSLNPREVRAITGFFSDSIKKMEALRPLKALETLDLSNASIRDISALRDLHNLQFLYLSNTQISTLQPLSELHQIRFLDANKTRISQLEALRHIRDLRYLDCSNTEVDSLDPVFDCHYLEHLAFNQTRVNDLNPIRRLKTLNHLYCHHTQISTLSPLRDLVHLQSLNVGTTKIENLSPLRAMTKLEELAIPFTKVDSLKPIKNLSSLHTINLDFTLVKDISILEDLKALRFVSLRKTLVEELEVLLALPELERVVLSQKQFSADQLKQLARDLPNCEISAI
ncbi:MAG: leucine-rich repeat domain-containing protein [Bacteroidota bacterium]